MVIKTEYGNEEGVVLKSQITRGLVKTRLATFTEGFYYQREQYRWGKMYSLRGKEQKLIRQF
jgi:hypothetical protein